MSPRLGIKRYASGPAGRTPPGRIAEESPGGPVGRCAPKVNRAPRGRRGRRRAGNSKPPTGLPGCVGGGCGYGWNWPAAGAETRPSRLRGSWVNPPSGTRRRLRRQMRGGPTHYLDRLPFRLFRIKSEAHSASVLRKGKSVNWGGVLLLHLLVGSARRIIFLPPGGNQLLVGFFFFG